MSNDPFDKLIARLQQQNQAKNGTTPKGDGFHDVNTNTIVQRQMMQQQMGRSPATTVRVVEGETFYKPLSANGWPTKYPLCRTGGTIPTNSPEFEYKGEVRVMCVDGQNVVDFSKLDESTTSVLTLVELSSPMIGKILVPKHAIMDMKLGGNNGGGKGIIFG